MKTRKIVFTVKVLSNESIKTLKDVIKNNINLEEGKDGNIDGISTIVKQIQANVIKD